MKSRKKVERGITRRKLLIGSGMAIAAGAAISSLGILSAGCSESKAEGSSELPWPYVNLNAEEIADRAYEAYWDGHCCYGVFEAIVGKLAQEIGEPYASFPTRIMVFGKGGIVGWGTVCGALNGAAAATYLVLPEEDADEVINELFNWYSQSELPDYTPAQAYKVSGDIPKSISRSPLCHNSVTAWSLASGFGVNSSERKERCARLTATVARKLVELVNAKADGTFQRNFPDSDEVTSCLACHGGGSVKNNVHIKHGHSCTVCHTDVKIIDPSAHP